MILISWYAAGWAGVALWCLRWDSLTIGSFLAYLLCGWFSLLAFSIMWLGDIVDESTIVWRRK